MLRKDVTFMSRDRLVSAVCQCPNAGSTERCPKRIDANVKCAHEFIRHPDLAMFTFKSYSSSITSCLFSIQSVTKSADAVQSRACDIAYAL